MSIDKGMCGECVTAQRVTLKGLIYKHGECRGAGTKPLTGVELDARYPDDDEFESRKTGYTDEDMHEMLHNLTPKRQKLRERISARWHWFKKNIDEYFDGGWDVYDD